VCWLSRRCLKLKRLARRPNSAGGAAGSGTNAKKALEAQRSRTPDVTGSAMLADGTVSTMAGGRDQSFGSPGYPNTSPMPMGETPNRGVLGSDAEERYVEAISHLKDSIVREQHTIRMLQAARATSFSKKSELEEFFLKCIDEARKELMRKRHMTMQKDKGERERVLEAMLSNEDVLVCLYEKIFPHRTGIARSLSGPNDAAETKRQTEMPMEELLG